MAPIPVNARVLVGVAGGVDPEISGGVTPPGSVVMLVMANDVIAVFGVTESGGFMCADPGGSLIHRFGIPGWIAGEPFVFGPGGKGIPTASVPGIINIPNHLRDF